MNRETIHLLACPCCGASQFSYKALSRDPENAVLLCRPCKEWFIIEEGILEMVTSSLNASRKSDFYTCYSKELRAMHLHPPQRRTDNSSIQQKKSQIEFFDDFSTHYVLETHPFWKAYYSLFFQRFSKKISPNAFILDIGCGSGLGSRPYINGHYTVIGVDLSREMLKRAISHLPQDQLKRYSFIVADAENLPFKNDVFDVCIGMGILHHVHDPRMAVRSLQRCLKKGGVYLGHENNKTMLRPLFDILMKLFTLWHEEAGEEQLLSANDLSRMCTGFMVTSRTHVFLPPHFFNLFSETFAKKLLRFTDAVLGSLPFVKHHGGTIIFEARKI